MVRGGRERTTRTVIPWLIEAQRLEPAALLTSWDQDGTRNGYDLALLSAAQCGSNPHYRLGWRSTANHMAEAPASAPVPYFAASIFHDNDLTPNQVKQSLQDQGIEVRPDHSIHRHHEWTSGSIGGGDHALDAGDPLVIAERFARVGPIAVIDLDAALGHGDTEIIETLCQRYRCRVGSGSQHRYRQSMAQRRSRANTWNRASPELAKQLPRDAVSQP